MGWDMGGGLGHVVPLLAVARALDKLGVGLTIPGKFTAEHFASTLLKTVNHPTLAANAAAVAAGLERPGEDQVLNRIVERCLALLGET